MKTTRRKLLYGLGGALAGASALSNRAQATETDLSKLSCTKPFKLEGMALTLGTHGVYHPDAFEDWKKEPARPRSLITMTDLETGTYKQRVLDMPDGHHAMRLGSSNRIVCIGHHNKLSMVLNDDLSTRRIFIAPDGFVYGGHGYVDEPNNVFVLPARVEYPKKLEDQGIFEVYDLKTLRKIDELPSEGIHPHEIRLLPNGKEIVVTHYGEIARNLAPKGSHYYFNIVEAKLSVYDAKTLKPLRHYVQEDLNAILSHMAIDASGNVFAVSNQYVPFGRGRSFNMIQALQEVEKITGVKHNFELNPVMREEDRIAIPLPVLRINPQTGEVKPYFVSNNDNRRSQSVAYQADVGKVFASFTYSNTLVTVDKDDKTEATDCFKYGITQVRGVDAVPGTPYMIISDSYRGIALIDANTMELVRLYDVPVYRSPHVHFDLNMA
jgi:hypothetical protein